VRIINHTEHRAVFRGRGEQAEHGGRDEQPVGMRGRRLPERARQGPRLGIGEFAQIAEDRPQQFMQPGEGEVGFVLHPTGGQDHHRRCALPGVAQ
jgi:hypothetical protein